jgi:hypothetical protein
MAVSPIDNRLLTQAREKAESSVPEPYTRGYTQIVAAGLKAMFSDSTFGKMKEYLASIKSPQDIPNVVAHGIIKLLSILFNASQGKMQIEASGPAVIVLMTHALDYVEDVMKMPISADILAQTTQLVNQGLMHFLKQATKMSDEDFTQILQGKGKELAAAKEAGQGAAPQPTAPAGLAQGAV